MELSIEATYEDGVLKPVKPLPLAEHTKVQLTVHSEESSILESYGIIGWTGDPKVIEEIALSPEFDPNEVD